MLLLLAVQNNPADSQASRILPLKLPQNAPNYNAAYSSPHLPPVYPLYVTSHLSIKTHTAHSLQRFSPIHF